jgi:hypothetical protein
MTETLLGGLLGLIVALVLIAILTIIFPVALEQHGARGLRAQAADLLAVHPRPDPRRHPLRWPSRDLHRRPVKAVLMAGNVKGVEEVKIEGLEAPPSPHRTSNTASSFFGP